MSRGLILNYIDVFRITLKFEVSTKSKEEQGVRFAALPVLSKLEYSTYRVMVKESMVEPELLITLAVNVLPLMVNSPKL